ncbi:FdtA/QdtA family cupin domain-containing protein [Planktomarina temperata]|nr:FdtA/QdtA family cupin domain-containing protein [Planktomarina temperata]
MIIEKCKAIYDERGELYVNEISDHFEVRRFFFIRGASGVRGLHSHKKTHMALVSVCGTCDVGVRSKNEEATVSLGDPETILILEPHEFHWMSNFSSDNVLLVLASTNYDPEDYIYEP